MQNLSREARLLVLKQASAQLVTQLGGIEGAAATLEKGKSVVGRWVNRNDADHLINVADLAALEAIAARPLVTETLCKLAGGIFVPHVDLAADEGTLGWLVMQLSKELGELSGEIAQALADGVVTPTEAKRAMAQLDDLDRVSAQLRGLLRKLMEDRA